MNALGIGTPGANGGAVVSQRAGRRHQPDRRRLHRGLNGGEQGQGADGASPAASYVIRGGEQGKARLHVVSAALRP